jgi:hypothetical protein
MFGIEVVLIRIEDPTARSDPRPATHAQLALRTQVTPVQEALSAQRDPSSIKRDDVHRADFGPQPGALANRDLGPAPEREVQRSSEALGDDTGANPQPRTFGEVVARRGEIAGCSRMDLEAAMPRHQAPQAKPVVGLEGLEL